MQTVLGSLGVSEIPGVLDPITGAGSPPPSSDGFVARGLCNVVYREEGEVEEQAIAAARTFS